jgi:sortase B
MRVSQGKELFDALESPVGKAYLVLGGICSMLFWERGTQLLRRKREKATSDGGGAKASHTAMDRVVSASKAVLRVVLVASAATIVRYRIAQKASIDVISDARRHVRYETEPDMVEEVPPVRPDFDSLIAANPDIVGWIYCEGTQIDFPVLKGKDNDSYLRRNWRREQDIGGSVLVDAKASDGFVDARTVIYGHHMNDNLMFASLEEWSAQSYYDEHPVMWLLTPSQSYKVELVAGEHIPAESDAYEPSVTNDAKFEEWLTQYVGESDFRAEATASPDARYIMLSTCAYVYENARFTLLGKLVAVG